MGDSLSYLDNLLFILDRPHKLDRYFNLKVDFNSEKRNMDIIQILIYMYIIYMIDLVLNIVCNSAVRINCSLGPIHTYPDIFEFATFSFQIQK